MPPVTAKRTKTSRKQARNPWLSRLLGRRVERSLRRRWVRRGLGALSVALSLAIVVQALGGMARLEHDVRNLWRGQVETGARALGLNLARVVVAGREKTDPELLRLQIGLQIGMPLTAIDVAAVRNRIEQISWVGDASVRLVLPDTLRVDLTERAPFAIWQIDGEFHVIDRGGVRLTSVDWNEHRGLPLVVGAGANLHVDEITSLLAAYPDIERRVQAAVRVRDRRWTLHLWNGVDVLLPEEDPDGALADFAGDPDTPRLLASDIERVDLRQSDRWLVRLSPNAADQIRNPGRET